MSFPVIAAYSPSAEIRAEIKTTSCRRIKTNTHIKNPAELFMEVHSNVTTTN